MRPWLSCAASPSSPPPMIVSKLPSVLDTRGLTQGRIGLAQSLASYFGDEDAVPDGMCGCCTFCKTGQGVDFDPTADAKPDPVKLQAILHTIPDRDDPRLLARMAFGITSPRLTANKWSTSHELFGSMVDADFGALVEAFDAECKKSGYKKSDAPPSSTTAKKRTYSQAGYETTKSVKRNYSGGGYGSGTRGGSYGSGRGGRGGNKRARGKW